MATETTRQATELPETRGFGGLPCPLCGEEATIRMDLDDLDNCTCGECSEEFKLSTIAAILTKWGPVVAWVAAAPSCE